MSDTPFTVLNAYCGVCGSAMECLARGPESARTKSNLWRCGRCNREWHIKATMLDAVEIPLVPRG